jgi:hypothetical protein
MHDKDNINSILNAINEINLKPKKKTGTTTIQRLIPNINQNLIISPDVDRLIREAEEYKEISTSSPKTLPPQNKKIELKKDDALILTEEVINESESRSRIIIELKDKVQNLEEIEKKLRSQIAELQKNNISLSKIEINAPEMEDSKNLINNTKATLKSIYGQVEVQKKLFLDLKNHSIKVERDSNVYRENYERLIIENNELKTRVEIAKEQIVKHERNKNDLLSALDQLNEILSKSNIVGKIAPLNPTFEKTDQKKETKIEPIE